MTDCPSSLRMLDECDGEDARIPGMSARRGSRWGLAVSDKGDYKVNQQRKMCMEPKVTGVEIIDQILQTSGGTPDIVTHEGKEIEMTDKDCGEPDGADAGNSARTWRLAVRPPEKGRRSGQGDSVAESVCFGRGFQFGTCRTIY